MASKSQTVEFDTFSDHSSAAEVGTTRASVNRRSKTNAAKGVSSHYNEYKEFHQREIEAHICASFIEMSGMKTFTDEADYDIPSKDFVNKDTRRKWLHEISLKLVDTYLMASEEIEPLVEQLQELERALAAGFHCRVDGCDRHYVYHSARVKDEASQHGFVKERYEAGRERDMLRFFHCKASCGLVFSTKDIRNNHEKINLHPNFSEGNGETEEVGGQGAIEEDSVFNYHRAKLAFGLILFEMDDAIKEGDGGRLHDLYKFALLIYKAYAKTKYAYAVLLHLVKIEAILSEEEAHSLMWNRTFNKYGLAGKNFPLDLRTEQFNKDVKCMWRALQANINEASAERVANTVEPMEDIRDSIKNDCGLVESPVYRSSGKPESVVIQIIQDLMQIRAFKHEVGKEGHPSFPDFPSNLLRKID